MEYDISVLIPAYNAEHTLIKVVDSVITAKKHYSVEIIIIENGSTDCTWEIAQNFQKKYNYISAVHSDKGVSHARNKGLEIASGKWICFLDADDEMTKEAFVTMSNAILSTTAELYIFGYWKNNTKTVPNIDNQLSFSDKQIALIKNPTKYLAVWGKLFSRNIILKNNICFDPMLTLSEDSDFLIHYMKHCNNIAFFNSCIYVYSIQGNSSTRGYTGDKKREYINAIQLTKNRILDQNISIQHAFSFYILMQLNLIMVKDIFCKENPTSFTQKCNALRSTCSDPIFKSALCDIHLKECTYPRLLPALLCKFHFWHLCGFIYWIRTIQNKYRSNKS